MKYLLILTIAFKLFAADDSIIKEIDMDLGQRLDYFSTAEDSSRFSVSGGSSYQLQTSKQLDFDLQYMTRLNNIHDGWLAFQFKKVQASYDYIADQPVSTSGNPNSDANTNRDGQIQDITLIGAGYAQRFKFLQEFIESNRVFETTAVYFNYVTSSDEATSNSYKGFGLTADFGVHKRAGKKFFYGAKLGYNIASVWREAVADEPKEDRSLAYSWTTLSFELGYFF